MSLPKFEYFSPKSLSRAIALQKEDGKFLAGGTDLLVAMKKRNRHPGRIIDLSAVSGLKRIMRQTPNQIRIGALTTLAQLKDRPLVQRLLPALSPIVSSISALQLQNRGTLGGNLCLDTRCYHYNQPIFLKKRWAPCFKIGGKVCHVVKGGDSCYAVYSGDMAPALIALDAGVKIAGPGYENEIKLSRFFSASGVKPNILKFNEILTQVIIPLPGDGSGLSYQKLRLRDTIDFPLLGVAIFLRLEPDSGICRDFRMVLGAVAPAPVVVAEAADILRGKRITKKLIEAVGRIAQKKARPVANTAASPKYRREMVPVLTKKAISEAMARIKTAGSRQ